MKKYIYYLHNINDLIPKYVGCTTQPIVRLKAHKAVSRKKKSDKDIWILSCNKAIEMKIILELGDEYTKKQALVLESQCIKDFISSGFLLTNSEFDIYCNRIGPHSEKSKELMRKNAARYWKGKLHSNEYKKCMSDTSPRYWEGKSRSEETKNKIKKTQTGKVVSEETKRKTSEAIKKHWILRKQRLQEEKC